MAFESLYDIPEGCICMGDGLMGVPCPAPSHAELKNEHTPCGSCGHLKSKHHNGRGICTAQTFWICSCSRYRKPKTE